MDRESRLKKIQLLTEKRKQHEKIEEEQKIKEELNQIFEQSKFKILSFEDTDKIENKLVATYPFASWGRIDWNKMPENNSLLINKNIKNELLKLLDSLSIVVTEDVYVVLGFFGYPALKMPMLDVLNQLIDIKYIGPDQWILGANFNYVIELTHDDVLTIGFKN